MLFRSDALRTKRKDEKEALHTVSFYEEEIGHSSKKKSADSISLVEEEKTQQVSPIKTPTSVKTKQSSPKKEEKIDHQKDDLTEKREDNNERARLIQNAWNNDRQNTRAEANDASSNYFEAVVHGTQEISNGGVLLIRTKEKIEHSGHTILPNTLISAQIGRASCRERVYVMVSISVVSASL